MAYRGSSTQRRRVNTVADKRLNDFINNNQNLKNQSTNKSILSTVSDAPQKFSKDNESRKAFIERQIRDNDGRINAAAQAMLDFYNDGRSDYSRGLNSLRTSSQPMMDAYARRFPISNFAMEMGPTIMGAITGIPFGLIEKGLDASKRGFDFAKSGAGQGLDSLVSGIDKGMGAVESGLDFLTGKASDVKDDAVDIFKEATTKRQEPSTFTAQSRPVLFNDASDNPLEQLIIDSQSVDTPGIERIFKLPSDFRGDFNNMYFTGVRDPSLKENYLVNNPNLQSLIGMNLNQGGLASLNNPDYNRLMDASNFGF